MKKKIIIASGCVVALCAVIGVSAWFFKGNDKGSENVVYVNTVESILGIGTGNGMQNRYAGVVESQEDWKIEKAENLVVEEILVKEGDEVEEGTPLVRYNMENIENDLSQAKLELERLNNDIANSKEQVTTLEKEKKAASADAKLDYTIRIQTTETEIKKNEYEKKSKEASIKKLEESLQNATVNSKIKGVVKKINKGDTMNSDGTDNSLITILKTGDLRIKGVVNEQNKSALTEGASLIIHSRIDEEKTWKGKITKIDLEAPISNNNNGMMMTNGSDNTTQSSSYPFYVEIESAQDLMLGQHVFIELDLGQEEVEEKEGIWLDEYFIVDADSKPYVWADNGKGKLEKKYITLGEKDENLLKYQVTKGITEEDKITFPEEGLEEGMSTQISDSGQLGQSNPENAEGEMNGTDMEGGQMEGSVIEGEETEGNMGSDITATPDESGDSVEATPDGSAGSVEATPDVSVGSVEVTPDGSGAVMEKTPAGGVG